MFDGGFLKKIIDLGKEVSDHHINHLAMPRDCPETDVPPAFGTALLHRIKQTKKKSNPQTINMSLLNPTAEATAARRASLLLSVSTHPCLDFLPAPPFKF